MIISEFVQNYKNKNFMNTPQGARERDEWIKKEIAVKEYIPFKTKREIAEMIVEQNIDEEDGIKRYNSIDAYLGFVTASITAHTSLRFSKDPIVDYDLLAESGLLTQIVSMFQESHNEIDVLIKMVVASELEDNKADVLIGRFLDSALKKLDYFSKMLGNVDFKNMFNEENMTKIFGLINKK